VSNFRDRRSTGNGKAAPATSTVGEGSAGIGHQARRVSKGARSLSEFFAPEKQRADLTRGEFLNLVGMLEYQRAETRWWRRVVRFLNREPQVASLIPELVAAHARTLAAAAAHMEAQRRQQAAETSSTSTIIEPTPEERAQVETPRGSPHA